MMSKDLGRQLRRPSLDRCLNALRVSESGQLTGGSDR
jgi:hypothetical protein